MSAMEVSRGAPGDEQLEPDVGSELSVVPLDKDSFGLCELCGTIGLRKNFYARDNKFCSLYCFRSHRSKKRNFRFTVLDSADHLAGMIPMEPLPQLDQPWPADLHDIMRPNPAKSHIILNSYEWKDELFGCDFLAAPVKLFKHAPLHEMWDATLEGMKVEVRNTDCDNNKRISDYFWVATVLKVKGYMGLLRYEGFGSDDSKDFWVNMCCSDVHPVGWCATRGSPLIPPRSIEHKYSDWKRFLVKQLTGARTLPVDFYTKLEESLRSRFSIGTVLEVVDKDRITQVKVASVYEIIGRRLHIKYYDSQPEDEGFWCHESSPLIHPVGWAFRVGHPLDAPLHYCERVAAGRLLPNDATPDMFFNYPDVDSQRPLFREGMKLEAIDPLNLSTICAATVMRVLNHGYMMIRIDVYPADASNSDWFCYHQRSPCIFPVGFSAANNIRLIPPAGYTPDNFSWRDYLASTNSVAASEDLFYTRSSVEHGLVAAMRLECVDLMAPQLVCVATVARVAANLIKVHFDGWGDEYDQWLCGDSVDIYPVGWCRAAGYRLEGPLQVPKLPARAVRKRVARKRKIHRHAPARDSSAHKKTNNHSTEEASLSDTKSVSPLTPSPETAEDNASQLEDHTMNQIKEENTMNHIEENTLNHNEDSATGEAEYNEMSEIEENAMNQMEDNTIFPLGDTATSQIEVSKPSQVEENTIDQEEDSAESPVMDSEPTEKMPKEDSSLSMDIDLVAELSVQDSKEIKCEEMKVIPRLVNNTPFTPPPDRSFEPELWTTADVAEFLRVNDCTAYCANFGSLGGAEMLALSKERIIELLHGKVGPSLKIYDLVQQLRARVRPHRTKFK